MPFARLTLNDPDLPQRTVDELAAEVTVRLEADLGKPGRIAVVQIDLVPRRSWYIGSEPVSGTGGHLEVTLSAGINTDVEKAAFIANTYRGLERILGQLAQIFSIEVDELPGKSWGYNGIPQADRHEDVD